MISVGQAGRSAEGVRAAAPALSGSMSRVQHVAAIAAFVLGLIGFIGRIAGSAALARVVPGSIEMRFNSALLILLLSAALILPDRPRVVVSGVSLVFSLIILAEYITQSDLGVDQLFVSDAGGANPGRLSIFAASSFALLALGHILVVTRRYRQVQFFSLMVMLLACVVLLGYAYEVEPLYAAHNVTRLAVPTAFALLLLSLGLLATVPLGIFGWIVDGNDAGAHLARRLIPLAIVGLPVLGFLCVLGHRADLFSNDTTSALIVIVCAATVGLFTWVVSRRLARVDRRRATAIAELTELRIDLERLVGERASQLQRRHNEIAVLEDRQRIAADLHDIVIQRLFAAGMYLQSGAEGVDEVTRGKLDSAVEAMDIAIKDLRASIFELGGRVHQRIDMMTAVSDVCAESGRVLGFEPDVIIDDPDEYAEAFREDVLAVLREALANVARHAEASAVDVVLRTGDGQLWLSVSDNGKGISESSRRSGTKNMALRARGLGGDCTWTRLQPRGTRVLWLVPLEDPADVAAV